MAQPIPLTQDNLPRLAEVIACPTYDRAALRAGIVHIGVGGFHRSHGAYYTDALLRAGGSPAWGICGVGLREGDRRMRDVLRAQDHLYALIVRHPDGRVDNRVIGSIVDFLLGPDDPAAVIDKMAHPDTRIVSLTITEGGYNFDPATGEFDFSNPDVQHELAHPDQPRTVFGYLAAGLGARRAAGLAPFTVQSCDNVQHNGDVTRKMLLAFLNRRDPELAAWVAGQVCFPNAMVDRITPVTTDDDIAYLQTQVGVHCAWPVTSEPFIQWVIQDRFSADRPDWDRVGAQFVSDVAPYERMKLRLLNAGHSVLGLLGSLHGHQTIDGAVADPLFATFLRAFMDIEATPTVGEIAGIDLDAYKDSLIERFGNPNLEDSLARICLESSAKLPVFLLPTLQDNLDAGRSIAYASLVLAAWCVLSDKGVSRHGEPLELVDALKDELHAAAAGTAQDPLSFLRVEAVFGDLVEDRRLCDTYTQQVTALRENPDVQLLMKAVLARR